MENGAIGGQHHARGGLQDLRFTVALWLVSRTALAVFVWLTGQHFRCMGRRCTDRAFFPDNVLLNGLFQWDALQYRTLAEQGYVSQPGFETTAPFFPGFPLAARVVGAVLGSPLAGGIVVNQLATIAGALLVAQIARTIAPREGAQVARLAAALWLLGPLSFFFNVFLSEALFSCLAAACVWATLRGKWLVLALAGFAAVLTRNVGVIVIAACAWLAWERRSVVPVRRWGVFAIAAGFAGVALFLFWQHRVFGNAWEWVESQRRWNRYLVWPHVTFQDDWLGFPVLDPARKNVDAMYRTQEVLAAALVLPLLVMRKRLELPRPIWALGAAMWLLPFLSHSLISVARYQAANIYFVLAGAILMHRHDQFKTLVWWASGLVMAWYASTYPHGVWAS